jgi:predicted PurR-regulated permease PerM
MTEPVGDASDGPPGDGVPEFVRRVGAWAWRLLAVALVIWIVGRVFKRLELVLVPITIALFLTTILYPAVRFLRRHRWPRLLSTWTVVLVALAIVAGVVTVLIPGLQHEFGHLGDELNRSLDQVRDRLSRKPFDVAPSDFDRYVNSIKDQIRSNRKGIFTEVTASAETVVRAIAAALLTVVLTFFFLNDGDRMVDWFVGHFQAPRARRLDDIAQRVWLTLTAYVRGTAINGAVNAAVIGTGLAVLRVPLVIPIVILTAISAFVPIAGAIVSGTVAALVALVSRGPAAALIMVGLTVVAHHLEGYLVGPFVLGRSVRLHPVVVLVSLTAGTLIGGIVGAFYAVPVVAIGYAVFDEYASRNRKPGDKPEDELDDE